MNQEIIKTISQELNVGVHQIEAVLSLLEEGNTVPFIARYRKEKTGALDEDQIRTIDKYYQYQVNLLKRKEDVIRLIEEKGMLNEQLKQDILKATQLSEVEDLYRPYKEKRKTKATAAKAKGLEPLSKWILSYKTGDLLVEAKKYLNEDVTSEEEAIQGALDIIAEDIADNIKYRKFLKDMLYKGGILTTKEKKKLILPEMLDTNELRYYQPFNERGPVITVMGMMIGILLYALQKQNIRKAEEERKKQMIEDYPEVISKLTLYLGAGMTVKKAWRKITEGYMKEKEDENERYVYEEMRQTCHEMDSGVTEAEGYENFGRRCDLQIYIRLGALLSQNLRKGTKGLSELLKLESIQAFEERKARAKRLGEEAGTKLLLPMFLMLVVVLIIVIVPAFLTMQI